MVEKKVLLVNYNSIKNKQIKTKHTNKKPKKNKKHKLLKGMKDKVYDTYKNRKISMKMV